jgi:hypothetical protein
MIVFPLIRSVGLKAATGIVEGCPQSASGHDPL